MSAILKLLIWGYTGECIGYNYGDDLGGYQDLD